MIKISTWLCILNSTKICTHTGTHNEEGREEGTGCEGRKEREITSRPGDRGIQNPEILILYTEYSILWSDFLNPETCMRIKLNSVMTDVYFNKWI